MNMLEAGPSNMASVIPEASRFDVLRQEAESCRLRLSLPAEALARAIVRICDVHLYAPLLGGDAAEIETALSLVALLLPEPR